MLVHPGRLSAQDAAFFSLEADGPAQNVGALMIFEAHDAHGGPLGRDELLALLVGRLHRLPRLRQRIVEPPGGAGRPRWVDDATFDLGRHVHEERVAAPGELAQLAAVVKALHAERLDRSRPLWDVTVLPGAAVGRTAVYFRWHHALVDGMSAVEIAQVLLDSRPDTPPGEPVAWRIEQSPDPRQMLGELDVERQVQRWHEHLEDLLDTVDPESRLAGRTQLLDGLLSFLALPPRDAPLPTPIGERPRVAFGDLDGQRLRALQRRHEVSAHELSVGLVAGALARWVRAAERPIDRLRALVPIVVATRERAASLGNHASFLLVDLPVGPMDEQQRLREVAASLRAATASGQARASRRLLELSDRLSPGAGRAIARLAADGQFVDVVVSSMRGLRRPIWLAGHRHVVTYPLLPQGRRVPLMVGIVNLGGQWGLSWSAPPAAIPALDFLAAGAEAFVSVL